MRSRRNARSRYTQIYFEKKSVPYYARKGVKKPHPRGKRGRVFLWLAAILLVLLAIVGLGVAFATSQPKQNLSTQTASITHERLRENVKKLSTGHIYAEQLAKFLDQSGVNAHFVSGFDVSADHIPANHEFLVVLYPLSEKPDVGIANTTLSKSGIYGIQLYQTSYTDLGLGLNGLHELSHVWSFMVERNPYFTTYQERLRDYAVDEELRSYKLELELLNKETNNAFSIRIRSHIERNKHTPNDVIVVIPSEIFRDLDSLFPPSASKSEENSRNATYSIAYNHELIYGSALPESEKLIKMRDYFRAFIRKATNNGALLS